MKDFLKAMVSKDERYVSILVIFAIIYTGIAIYMIFSSGDIPSNTLTITIWLYGFVAANSSVPEVVEKLKAINGKE